MPRPDAAQLIGNNLGALPGPDGRELRFMHHRTFGHSNDTVARINNASYDVGERIVHLLETNGYSITHKADPAPDDTVPAVREVTMICKHCGNKLAKIAVDENLTASLHRVGLQQLAQLNVECPHA